MAVPSFQELRRPVLEAAVEGEQSISKVVDVLADRLAISDEDRNELLPSGTQTRFANRVHWAKSYILQAGLVRSTRRGHFTITDAGRQALADCPAMITDDYLRNFESFREFEARSKPNSGAATKRPSPIEDAHDSGGATPDEDLISAHKEIEANLANDLLNRVREASPQFFEDLLVNLLTAMGYGGATGEAGRTLGQTGDRGVDGVIDQDPLGVDQIYIQAKRYAIGNQVGAGDIRDFFGALNLRRASKGIFFTTSRFTVEAERTAADLGMRIVLIDGIKLGRLLVNYNVGCLSRQTLELKEIDETFFDEED